MSYNANIPIITDPILQSSRQIKANFQAISNAFANNHSGLTTDQLFYGKHTVLILRPQTGDPTTSATQIALYNKLVSTVPNIFFRPNSNQTPIQMTYSSLKADSSDTQYSFVAGPFIIYGGKIASPSNGQVVNLAPGFALIHVDLTITNNNSGVLGVTPTAIVGNTFTISFTPPASGTFDVFYFAIGI